MSSQNMSTKAIIDSITIYRQYSKDKNSYSNQLRLSFAQRARLLSINLQNDTIIINSNRRLSTVYWELSQTNAFKSINLENLKLSNRIGDSSSLAKANYNIGLFYRYEELLSDSAYYYYHKAEKIYRQLKNKVETARTILEIAIIQKNEKDFIGSEVASIEAISLLDSFDDTNDVIGIKTDLYNNLGAVFEQLEQYDEAIKYHKKAIKLKRKLEGDNRATIVNSKNNLASAYKNSGQYDLAIKYYNEILANKNLINERPDVYALVLDNYANVLYLSKKYNQLPKLYLKALRICDSLGGSEASYNSIIINQHLAQYYNDQNKKDSAKYYAYRAKDVSEQYHNDDLLKSLLLLSRIEEDSLAVKHYNAYIKLSDSLIKNERTIRNRFARIRFETKEIEQKNIQFAREKMWLIIISVIVTITALLIFIVIVQRSKNNELKFVQKQQETNEEIYNLMLSQQENIEEARTMEKRHISQELHDGILGRLFGTRLSLDSLNLGTSKEAIATRGRYIQDLKLIEEDIRKVSHELNTDFISGSGFLDIIKTLLETQAEAYNLKYTFNYNDSINWEDISNKNKIHIYRIIQESIHNIYKHANATVLKISFELKKNVICLTIADDGAGFNVNKTKNGIGLKNIYARVKEINGEVIITSKKEIGTTVKINVPI
tara:strand:- start:2035 stop:4017 length:1983 start_codon:yes stop_codon:yes gene_type:complete